MGEYNKSNIKTEVVEEFINKIKLSRTKFCKIFGYNRAVLQKLLDGTGTISFYQVYKLAHIMGLMYFELFRKKV